MMISPQTVVYIVWYYLILDLFGPLKPCGDFWGSAKPRSSRGSVGFSSSEHDNEGHHCAEILFVEVSIPMGFLHFKRFMMGPNIS